MKTGKVIYLEHENIAIIRKGNKRSGLKVKLGFGPSPRLDQDVCSGCIFWETGMIVCASPRYNVGQFCHVLLENEGIKNKMYKNGYKYAIPVKIV